LPPVERLADCLVQAIAGEGAQDRRECNKRL
jgi:hypothetical protein